MKQIIFSATNDKGESLLDFAIREGEIWTARKSTKLKVGDKVRLIRKYGGKHEAKGIANKVISIDLREGTLFTTAWEKSGFSSCSAWVEAYCKINKIQTPRKVKFIHITNIRRLK